MQGVVIPQGIAAICDLDGTYRTNRGDQIAVVGGQAVTHLTDPIEDYGVIVAANNAIEFVCERRGTRWCLDRRCSSRRMVIWISEDTGASLVWTATHDAAVMVLEPPPPPPPPMLEEDIEEPPPLPVGRGADGGLSVTVAFEYWFRILEWVPATSEQDPATPTSTRSSCDRVRKAAPLSLPEELEQLQRAIQQQRESLVVVQMG